MAESIPKDNKKQPEIRKSYVPKDSEINEIRMVYERKTDMADSRSKFEKEWDDSYKAWDQFVPEKSEDDWQSDIYIPITTSVIEAILSEIVNQDLMPWAIPRGFEDVPKAVIVNHALQWSWDIAKSDVALFDILKETFITGTGIGQEYFWHNERDILVPDKKNGGWKTQRAVEYDDCYLEPVKLEDFYVDETGRSFDGPYQAKDCIRRYIMNYDDFRNFFQGKWDPFGNAKFVVPGGDVNYYEWYKPPEAIGADEVEVLWYWSKRQDKLAIVANDVLIKDGPNPYKHKQLPFARAIDVKRPHQFYAKGEATLLKGLQEEQNTLRRMIIDRNHLDIDKPILVSDALTIEDEDAVAAPHKIIPVGDPNSARFPEYSDIPLSVWKTLEMNNDDKVRVTGMDERQQSVSQAGTATEAAILKEATLRRINMKVYGIKNDFLVDVGRLRVPNMMQYYSQPKFEAILGDKKSEEYKNKLAFLERAGKLEYQDGVPMEKSYRNMRIRDKKLIVDDKTGQIKEEPYKGFTFFEIKPEFFLPTHGGYDIRYKASSQIPISKPLKQQKDMEMYDRLIQNPTVDPWKLAEMLFKSGDYDPDEYKIKNPEEGGFGQEQEGEMLKKMVELASVENNEMINGKEIGPTPYASPVHTELHIEFMKSKDFKELVPPEDQKTLQIFANHVIGELMAQGARGQGQGMGGEMGMGNPQGGSGGIVPSPKSFGGVNNAKAAVAPGMNQGGGQMPSGMQGAQTGIQMGRKI